MAFDIEKMLVFSTDHIVEFADAHQEETFYAFAIDANFLCLNSEEAAAKSLKEYRERWGRQARPIATWTELTEEDLSDADFLLRMHSSLGLDLDDKDACLTIINQERDRLRQEGNPYFLPERIADLRANTGDWKYQGFATLGDGFDDDAYDDHYGMSSWRQKISKYGRAMDKLVKKLKKSNAFEPLRRTPDFYACRVEHE